MRNNAQGSPITGLTGSNCSRLNDMIQTLLQDLRYGVRMLRKNPMQL